MVVEADPQKSVIKSCLPFLVSLKAPSPAMVDPTLLGEDGMRALLLSYRWDCGIVRNFVVKSASTLAETRRVGEVPLKGLTEADTS